MPRIPDEPLRKVTLNLYESDVAWFQQKFGQGYSEIMRQAVREFKRSATAGDNWGISTMDES
jgi:hypothetical protein